MCDGHLRDGCGVFGPLALRFRFPRTSHDATALPFGAIDSSTYTRLIFDETWF